MTAHQLSFEQAFVPVSDRGKRVEKRVYLESGQIPVVDQGEGLIGGYTDDEALAYEGPLPVLVFGDHTRRIKFVDFPFAVGAQGIKLLQPRECWHPKYIAYQLAALKLDDRGYSRHYQLLRKETFVCPPLDEQRRIVAEIEERLSRLEAGVAALKRVQVNLKRYHSTVLSSAVTGALTSCIPEQWQTAAIEELAADIRYGTSAKTSAELKNGIPVLRMGNIEQGRLVFDSLKYLSSDHPEFPALLLKPGDLLFNRTNSPELVGKSAVYHGMPEECSFASYLIRVRLGPRALPDFVNAYINSSLGKAWVKNVVSQQVGQANVNGSKLKALDIPLPSIEEQNQIVAEIDRRLSVVEELETQVSADLARAERLRQATLSKAFS